MKQKIHMRIFIPVLLVLVLFPATSWLVFSCTSGWYVEYEAENEAKALTRRIRNWTEENYGSINELEEKSREEAREISKELRAYVKETMKNGKSGASALIFNTKGKMIYPDEEEYPVSQEFSEKCMEMIQTGMLENGKTARMEFGKDTWALSMFEIESLYNLRGKYFISYARIPDTGILLSYTGQLMGVISTVIFVLAAAAVWLVAKSISDPLKDLCEQTEVIGRENYKAADKKYSIWEVEKLKEAFDQMASRLKEEEEQNNRFFQNISHDLRTPLVSISGYAQGIQFGVIKDTKKAAEIILSESARMTTLVESLLTMTKLENGQWKLNLVRIPLEEFLEEQVEILQGMSSPKKLFMAEENDACFAKADPDLLIRIFQNVVSNCVRYGKSMIEVRLKQDHSWAVIIVSDDGPGIPEGELPFIFQRFYRGKDGDFGIGLSIVRAGLAYMGGKAEVKNKALPQCGAVYKLYLPLD